MNENLNSSIKIVQNSNLRILLKEDGNVSFYTITKKGKTVSKPQLFIQKGIIRGHRIVYIENGQIKTKYVHRVIAENLIPNPDNLPYVDFIDGDRTNFNINNLKWVLSKPKNPNNNVNYEEDEENNIKNDNNIVVSNQSNLDYIDQSNLVETKVNNIYSLKKLDIIEFYRLENKSFIRLEPQLTKIKNRRKLVVIDNGKYYSLDNHIINKYGEKYLSNTISSILGKEEIDNKCKETELISNEDKHDKDNTNILNILNIIKNINFKLNNIENIEISINDNNLSVDFGNMVLTASVNNVSLKEK